MKKITDYLHLYLWCDAIIEKSDYFMVHNWVYHKGDKIIVDCRLIEHLRNINTDHVIIKPILRPLSDMSEEERYMAQSEAQCFFIENEGKHALDISYPTIEQAAITINYLRKLYVDCDGLIEAGLAIDAKTLINTNTN